MEDDIPAQVEQALRRLFAPEVALAVAYPILSLDALFPEEQRHVANAVDKRQAEFATTRVLARQALAQLGIGPVPLVPNPDRSPVWPPGIVGSISHSRELCAVVVAKDSDVAGIGLDIEGDAPLEQKLLRMICTARERDWLASLPQPDQGRTAKLIFSAKEAAYKCQYPVTARFLGFHEAELSIDLAARQFSVVWRCADKPGAKMPPPVAGGFEVAGGHMLCAARLE
jgi:4'-phosphopantetheinyl transferase EntD